MDTKKPQQITKKFKKAGVKIIWEKNGTPTSFVGTTENGGEKNVGNQALLAALAYPGDGIPEPFRLGASGH